MRSSYPSSSCSNSSFSSHSLAASTSLSKRLETVFKKASELCILCEIDACVIHYGPDGELKTWPEDRDKVRDMALRYSQLNESLRRKKSVDLYGFLNKKKVTDFKNLNKKTGLKEVNGLKYPISDHYSPDQVSQLIQSLEINVSTFQERLRFLESRKQKETRLDHQSSTPSPLNHHHQDPQHQTQSLNPSQYSLFLYDHGDATLSQIPLSASNFNQDFSPLLQESGLNDHSMKQDLGGYDPNMCMGNINSNNFQHPYVSNTEHYTAVQESLNNYGLNQLTPHQLYGCDQNMCMSGNIINSNNFQHPCFSNTEHYSAVQESVNNYVLLNQLMQQDLYGCDQNMCTSGITYNNVLDPYGNLVGNTSLSQDLSDMSSSYGFNFDGSSLVETSTLPSLTTGPNSYLISDNSRFF